MKKCFLFICSGLLFCLMAGPTQAAALPNIVFILADDLGINDLACYGRRDHQTPNLDRMAAEGVRFTSAYCAQPICSPSRAAILTGKSPARLHLTTFLPGRADAPSQKLLHPVIQQKLVLEEVTLAEHLKRAGYISACIGKWHLGGKGFQPTDQGFDFHYAGNAVTKPSTTEGGKGEYDLTRRAMEFIETNRTKPFFLYLSHNSPHIPYSANTNLVAKNAHAFEPFYASVIESLDDAVGQLLAKIDSLNIASNTIVIFTSDNGGLHVPEGPHEKITHNTPFRAGKGFLYEGGLRIPLIVRWPGQISAGRVINEPVINTDWLPTLLEIASETMPKNVDGESFADLLMGKTATPRRNLFWHFPHYTNQGSRPGGAMREGDWKLIEHYDTGLTELFNLRADISETNDLARQQAERVRDMRAKLATWRVSVRAQTNAINPNFDPALFAALYEETDPTRYNALNDGEAGITRMLAWRKKMNAVLAAGRQPAPRK